MEAVLIIGHGSRSLEAQSDFKNIVGMVKKKLTDKFVKGAHMENAEPNIPDTVESILKEKPDLKLIKVIPYFLYSGIHIKEDIPEILVELKEKYPQVEFKLGNALGKEEALADILIKRMSEI